MVGQPLETVTNGQYLPSLESYLLSTLLFFFQVTFFVLFRLSQFSPTLLFKDHPLTDQSLAQQSPQVLALGVQLPAGHLCACT